MGGVVEVMKESESPSFFKILRRQDPSSDIMRRIPYEVIRRIPAGSFSYNMVLKVAWGSSWTVKVSKNPSFYYMEDYGWNKFVNDNALGDNEHLTFTHEGNMCFKVSICDPDGLDIVRPRPSAFMASGSGLNRNQRRNMYEEVKEEVRDSLSESSYPSPKRAKAGESRLKQNREHSLGRKRAEETETSVLVPEFNLTIKKSHLLFLSFPKSFLEMYMPKETTTFKIHNLEGKRTWQVLFLVTDVQSRFSAGWSLLAREMGLKIGDICNFKLITPTDMLLKVSRYVTLYDDVL